MFFVTAQKMLSLLLPENISRVFATEVSKTARHFPNTQKRLNKACANSPISFGQKRVSVFPVGEIRRNEKNNFCVRNTFLLVVAA